MPPRIADLKQRLAALSNDIGGESSSFSSGRPSLSSTVSTLNAKRKAFVPPWKKNQHDGDANGGAASYEDMELVQEVLSKMIFQAGVDYETRPMVVLNASALPDPQLVSYDLLLSRILAYLNLYVEADYTVVFFAAGNTHTPGWNWIWKAHRSLSRKYRKNLKQLYIVHSSFFSKMLFSLAGAIISPKFFRKIVYVSTLSELAHFVPLTQIDVPPAVYQENLKYEQKITLPIPVRSSTFGVPLEDIMGYGGEKGGIPRVVRDCIQYLRESGMQEEGLFRRSPSSVLLRAVQEAYDRGNVVSLHTFDDPHLAAVLIKKYLRDLPEPLFPEHLYPLIRKCPMPTENPNDMNSVLYLRETLLPALAPCAYILLNHILHLLHEVSLRTALNRMDSYNLAIVLCPNLVKGSNPIKDVGICAVPGAPSPHADTPNYPHVQNVPSSEGRTTLGSILALCIRRYYEIFDELPDRTEAALNSHSSQYQYHQPSSQYATSPFDTHDEDEPSPYVIHDEDDEFDDYDEFVMPRDGGTGHTRTHSRTGSNAGSLAAGVYAKRHRSQLSGGSNAAIASMRSETASAHLASASTSTASPGRAGHRPPFGTVGRAKSLINIIEQGSGLPGSPGMGSVHGKRGSVSQVNGTVRKGSGAAVEAVSVTAAGFFAPPQDAPPLPSSSSSSSKPKPPLPPRPDGNGAGDGSSARS